MGAKTWMLVVADSNPRQALAAEPTLDVEASQRLAAALYPNQRLEPIGEGSLAYTCPPDAELLVGCFPGVAVLAAKEFGIDRPSKLARHFSAAGANVTLHAMHSVVDWFAYAVWQNGQLQRSLSLSPDSGIIEDLGERLPFEIPFWVGSHPAVDAEDKTYPLPFHPLDLAEAALAELFGYQLEGFADAALLDPESIPLLRYRRHRPAWWKFWR